MQITIGLENDRKGSFPRAMARRVRRQISASPCGGDAAMTVLQLDQFTDTLALDPEPLRLAPVVVDSAAVALEGGTDPAFGTVRWRTLLDAERAGSADMVLGVAEFEAHGRLERHRHTPSEFYLGLSGDGTVTIEGTAHRIAPGVAIFIPRDAEHGVEAGPAGLSFAYGFPRARFSEVEYRFSAAAE